MWGGASPEAWGLDLGRGGGGGGPTQGQDLGWGLDLGRGVDVVTSCGAQILSM